MKVRDHWIYWTCQIAGWGGYTSAGLAAATVFAGPRLDIIVGFVLFFLYSIALTHLLGWTIRRQQWLMRPASRALPPIAAAAVCVGVTQTMMVVLISRILHGDWFDRMATASTAVGVTLMTCAWTAIYVGFHWYRRYRHAELRDMESQLSLRQAELRLLQAQVNPHFLFNSLNAIRGTVSENPEKAQEMVTSLANLFRRSLRADAAPMVSLAEELAGVTDYLALESARFEERLTVCIDIAPGAGKCILPVMLIQTLAENAVKHGISRLPDGGVLAIRGVFESETLVVEVENTGTLVDAAGDDMHTGLANARRRLHLLCGDRATLELTGRDGKVAAKVVIPQRQL
jgi:hypothetical protein